MKYSIVSRVLNQELVDKSHSLLDKLSGPKFCLFGTSAVGYIQHLFKNDYDSKWIINIDEDAFVFDVDKLMKLLIYMEDNDYHICGMADGGVARTRFHNPVAMNPFFNIINHDFTSKIKYDMSQRFNNVFKSRVPYHLFKENCNFQFDEFEEFYVMFYNLLINDARFLYLDIEEYGDRYKDGAWASILKDHNGEPFLIHSWYARDYAESPDRINSIFNYAVNHIK